jgi:transposase
MDALPAQTAAMDPKSLHSQLRYKRLQSRQFHWPPIEDGMMKLSAVQLSALLEGSEWMRMERRDVVRPSATQ